MLWCLLWVVCRCMHCHPNGNWALIITYKVNKYTHDGKSVWSFSSNHSHIITTTMITICRHHYFHNRSVNSLIWSSFAILVLDWTRPQHAAEKGLKVSFHADELTRNFCCSLQKLLKWKTILQIHIWLLMPQAPCNHVVIRVKYSS